MIVPMEYRGVCLVLVLFLAVVEATDSIPSDERTARAWHHSLPGPQMLMQQHQPAPASTSQPGDPSLQQAPSQHQQNDPNVLNRNFEDQDKAVPAASEQDFLSRHFGYMNVHRFDPNFPFYDRNVYPRFPSPQLSQHTPRFGPGYRKDKYGHGYGYSCKQGDDCDEVRAANQLAAAQPPPHMAHPHHHTHGQPFGSNYPELPPFPSLPSFPGMTSSFSPYGGPQFGQAPARFNDPHMAPPMPPMYPSRFYHGRYLHDEEGNSQGGPAVNQKGEHASNKGGHASNNYNGEQANNNYKAQQAGNNYNGEQASYNYKAQQAGNNYNGEQTSNNFKTQPAGSNYKALPPTNNFKSQPANNNYKAHLDSNNYKGVPANNNHKGLLAGNDPGMRPEDSQTIIDDVKFRR